MLLRIIFVVAAVFAGSLPLAAQERRLPQSQSEVQLSYAPVVKQVSPAVVNVFVTTLVQQQVSPFANDPFFRRFFGSDSPLFKSQPRENHSLGSGVIVDSSGVVLTNSHVIEDATDIRVVTTDGREYDVELLLNDSRTDLAVLKIVDADRVFPSIPFGDSDALEVGDLVLALGNPFGVGQTVTSGIVSALARTGVETSDYGFFIQTDAAINPGNSGGALVNMAGELIGVNSSIFTRSGGSLGIGFAIPANMARLVAEAGQNGREIIRPWFGVDMQDVTADLADSLGIDPPRGALIAELAKGGPADLAGLRSGDVIIAIDGVAIRDPRAFNFRLATKPVGGSARVSYIRGGNELQSDVSLEAFPSELFDLQIEISGNTRFSGIRVQQLTAKLADELALPLDLTGVIVVLVESGSPAELMGLKKNDVIVVLNGEVMDDLEKFGALASKRARSYQILIQRGDRVIRSTIRG